jgi:hypothetical protein
MEPEWCGTRRTVSSGKGREFAGLEFGGFCVVPQRVAIKNQLITVLSGIESGNFTLLLLENIQILGKDTAVARRGQRAKPRTLSDNKLGCPEFGMSLSLA